MADLNRVTVIYYHSVGPVKRDWEKRFLTLDPAIFEKHLAWLRNRYISVSLKEYLLIRQGLMPPVKNPLVITFDDGYLDNWIWAFPLLKKYGLKATIFVSPEFVDDRAGCRPNPEDHENGRAVREESSGWGFLSWDEMRVMESSGLIDIQSHSLTHTKYFVSDKLTGFHHPGGNILYPVINAFPEIKPDYIGRTDFESLLPYGFPLFEERPALMARRVEINPDFTGECVRLFSNYDFTRYDQAEAFRLTSPLYDKYVSENKLIVGRESEEEYEIRVSNELSLSKKTIEERLGKKVEFLCWPHGSNDEFLHQKALEAGYLMTTTGKARGVRRSDMTRIPDRAVADLSTPAKRLRTVFRMRAFSGQAPYYQILNASRWLRNK
jgi:hypothetical protein